MKLAYIRVSSETQNEERQFKNLEKYDIEKFFHEKRSGKNMFERPELKKLLEFAREGDTIYIDDFSRLARSCTDLLKIVEVLNNKGVHLVSNKENLNTSTPQGKLMLTLIGAIAEFEREQIKERQREGIAIAKQNGKYKGRQKKKIDKEKFEYLYKLFLDREVTKKFFSEELNVSRPTLDKLIIDYKKGVNIFQA